MLWFWGQTPSCLERTRMLLQASTQQEVVLHTADANRQFLQASKRQLTLFHTFQYCERQVQYIRIADEEQEHMWNVVRRAETREPGFPTSGVVCSLSGQASGCLMQRKSRFGSSREQRIQRACSMINFESEDVLIVARSVSDQLFTFSRRSHRGRGEFFHNSQFMAS